MKKVFLLVLISVMGAISYAQTKIQFRSADKAECVKSDYTSLKASFSFSGLEALKVETERGSFSELTMPNTIIGGNEGDPQIPVVNELIAVPFGANPTIKVTSYSATDYNLSDFGIERLIPRQPSLRKDKKPEEVPFLYNAEAYQTRGMRSEPKAVVQVMGTMRGVQLGKMTIEPMSYDPVSNTIRVFNDIEVEVSFDGADAKATEQMLVDTYSPYFDIIYKQLFNGRAVLDAYTAHPDLYSTPVRMLVVATSAYQSSTAFQNWLTWKKQKGIYVDIYTVTSSTASSTIRTEIQSRYNTNHPTFLVIVGDETVVKAYKTDWSCGSNYGNCVNDMEYASVDSDVYHDMYMSRMSVSSTTELENLVNKILTYEKYTMSDPTYLNNSLLVAGWDSSWTNRVGKPTIQYANNNYYNSAHGINPTVYITTGSGQTAAWNNINNVGFVNYTAHGDIQELADPEFTNSNANSMTNNDKYLWIVANCCLTANWGNNTYKPCLGETMIRAANKGAFGYIGSIPESYWYEDYYFGVGAFSYVASTVQTTSSTTTGMYDALFDDSGFNTLNSVPYIGNVAVTYAHAAGYTSSVTDEYYWRAYQCLGDGSVMPYLKNPSANSVSHASQLNLGTTTFRVNAVAGSYVAITVNNEIIGVGQVSTNGYVDVQIAAQTATGTAMIVVTRNQRQPYITTIPIVGGEQYDVYANANPTAGGTVSGAGKYYEDTECTLVATPNAPQYEFTNWKKGSATVSTNPTYTFTVSSSTAGTYTANFTALTAHSITCNSATNGSISADKTTAYKGETVTLTANGNDGYILSSWYVRDANNNSITVTNNQFTMPDSNVTVTATFTAGYKITLASVMNGSISADPNCALVGTTINLTATPATGFVFDSWVVYKTGDPSTTVTVTNNKFTMPAYDVTVSAVFLAPQGGDFNIGSGTATDNGNYLPTNVWYKYSLTQQIYTKAELGDAGTITAISFYYNSSSSSGNRTLDIYMNHTTSSTISSWVTESTSHRVFSGTHNFTQGWNTITLSTPFAYNGTNNILLTVDDNTGNYDVNGSTYFYTYSTGSNRAIRYYNDNTNLSATSSNSTSGTPVQYNAQMKITKEVPSTDPYISLSPTALTGFTYPEGQGPSEVQTVSVIGRNITGNMTVTAPADYEVSSNGTSFSSSLSLTASNGNIQTTVYVRLKDELAQGNYNNKTLVFTSGSTTQNVTLSGNVTEGAGTYYTVSVTAEPEVGGIVGGAGRFEEGSNVTITATPNAGYSFTGWTKNGNAVSSSASYSFTLTEATAGAYVANFIRISYTIFASANPVEGGSVTGGGSYYEGTPVNLVATANTGYAFVSWTQNGSVVSNEPSYTFNAMAGGSFVANFEPLASHTITVSTVEGGTLAASANTAYPGDVITLTATPNTGSYFVGWVVKDGNNQTISVTNNQFTMPNSNVTVSGSFAQGFVITLADANNGSFTANKTSALPGETITLSATPDTDWFLSTWYVFKTGDARTIVTVTNDQFEMPEYDVTVMAIFKTTVIEDVTIGSGTDANAYLPTFAYYNYSLTEQIYTAEEVGEAGSISAIAFKVSNSKSTTRNMNIYMKHTNASTFASTTGWETVSALFQVYSGSVTFNASGWTTITLDTPFEYDGVRNLLLCVDDNTGSYVNNQNNSPKFLVYSTGENRAIQIYNDGTNYEPFFSNTVSGYTGTLVTSNNQVVFTKAIEGGSESLTVTPNILSGLTYEEGNGPSDPLKLDVVGVDITNDITINAPTNFEVSLDMDGTFGSTVTIARENKGNRGVTTWDFEDSSIGSWTTIDSDGDGNDWMVASNKISTGNGNNASNDCMLSQSYDNNSGALTPDNWLISPQVTLGGSFSLWAAAQDASYFAEHFGIYVSTTSNTNTGSFTQLGEWTLSAKGGSKAEPRGTRVQSAWAQYTVDLSAYANQTGYIAIRHFGCTDQFYLLIDDLKLDTDAEAPAPEFPVTITSATVYVHLKSNLNAGEYDGTLTANMGSISSNVSLSGEVTNSSVLTWNVTVTANPAEGGIVSGGGSYNDQATIRLNATANEGYTFVSWTQNGEVISNQASTAITADGDKDLVANFELNSYEVTVNVNPADAGSVEGAGTYNHNQLCELTATPAEGYAFTGWMHDVDGVSTPISEEEVYAFNVTEAITLVACFELIPEELTYTFNAGWNWWSTNLNTDASTLLAELENAMDGNGIRISSQTNGNADYSGDTWSGTLNGIDVSKMYKINVSDACEVTLNGFFVDPSECTITLRKNTNWIGYTLNTAADISTALANLTPNMGDIIKCEDFFATYYGEWMGSLETLEPGKGYIYKNTSNSVKTFTYTEGSKGTVRNNISSKNNFWAPERGRFANNMNIIAIVELDGVQQASDNLEVGAFVNGECRGSAKLMYVESLQQHLAFITVSGENGETVTFKALNDGKVVDLDETISIHTDEVVGSARNPFVLHNGTGNLSLFPNPAVKGETVRMELPADTNLNGATIEVYNALGALVRTETLSSESKELSGMQTSGIYTVKVVDTKGNVFYGKLIVR